MILLLASHVLVDKQLQNVSVSCPPCARKLLPRKLLYSKVPCRWAYPLPPRLAAVRAELIDWRLRGLVWAESIQALGLQHRQCPTLSSATEVMVCTTVSCRVLTGTLLDKML